MRAARIGLVLSAALAACSLSLDGDHFRGDPADPDAGSAASVDARAPEHSRPPPDPDAAPEDIHLECVAPTDSCKPRCEEESCTIDCRQADSCEAACKQATCTIDCTGARHCDRVKCEEDSGCLLDCTGAERCGFDRCDGEVTSCPGDLLACNRDCP